MAESGLIDTEARERMRKTFDEIFCRKHRVFKALNIRQLAEKSFIIAEGETGWTYEKIFGEYLHGSEIVTLIDSYIRKKHQIWNFERFCELALKTNTVQEIKLITYFDDDYQKQRNIEKFNSLKKSLCKNGIIFTWSFKTNEHDRFIILDNGWCINIGFGLDIYKKLEKPFAISKFDSELRPCKKTVVNIFRATRFKESLIPR